MTEVCRFDFNSVCVAVFDRSTAMTVRSYGNWIADRGSEKTFADSNPRLCGSIGSLFRRVPVFR